MTSPEPTQRLRDLAERAAEIFMALPAVQGVSLFGSVARGGANDASDIDLLVVGSDPELSTSKLRQELPDELRAAKWSLVYHTAESLWNLLESASPFAHHLQLESEILRDPDNVLIDIISAGHRPRINSEKELGIRLAQLSTYSDLSMFKGDFLYPLSHLYSIGKSIVMLALVVNGEPEFNRDAAFMKFVEHYPELATQVTVIARLRPFHMRVTRRASEELPFPSQNAEQEVRHAVDAIRQIARSIHMSQSTGPSPVERSLFVNLEGYARELDQGLHKPGEELSPKVVDFCTAFFRQFLKYEVGPDNSLFDDDGSMDEILFDEDGREAVIELRERLEREGVSRPVADLLYAFQDLCDLWPDLAYDSSESTFRQFHQIYLPRLLEDIELWSKLRGYADITNGVAIARRAFHFSAPDEGVSDQAEDQPSNDRTELIRLVELDYQRTADFISGLMQRQVTMRSLAVTVWAAILGLAFDRSLWELGMLTAISVLVFLFLDGYYTVLYMDVRNHASQLEKITADYYKSVIRHDDRNLSKQLKNYDFGFYGSMREFRVRRLWRPQIRQRVMYRYFYPFLALVAVVATILIAARH